MKVNVAALKDALEWAEAGGDKEVAFSMDYWFHKVWNSCGTTMCLGGRVVSQAGAKFVPSGPPSHSRYLTCVLDGTEGSVLDKAAAVTGLSNTEAHALFTEETPDGDSNTWAARSLAFLRMLIERFEEDPENHMTDFQVDDWMYAWDEEHIRD